MSRLLPMGTTENYERAVAALPRTLELAAEPTGGFYRQLAATTLVGMATHATAMWLQAWGVNLERTV